MRAGRRTDRRDREGLALCQKKRKASHRGHGGHRGVVVGTVKAVWGTAWLLGEKDVERGEHRTEATEGFTDNDTLIVHKWRVRKDH
jgi:hypothetical protein